MKDYLLDGLKTAAGCYMIVNLENGKRYIGKTRDLSQRHKDHQAAMALDSRDFVKIPAKMRADVADFPPDAFEFYPLCYCDLERLELNERTLMQALKPEYNENGMKHVAVETDEQRSLRKLLKWARGMLKATEGRHDAWAVGMRRAIRHRLRETIEQKNWKKREHERETLERLLEKLQ